MIVLNDGLQNCDICKHKQVCKFSKEFTNKQKDIKEKYNNDDAISPIHIIVKCKHFDRIGNNGVPRGEEI